MAGEWLKFDKATPDKPEVFAIASFLGIDPDAVVGKLMRVWAWFDTHTAEGNATGVTPALLDRIAGVSGFVAAMARAGWMVVDETGCSLPNFARHCGETAKTRALGAKRSAGFRSRNADDVTDASPEKRREEEKEQEQQLGGSPGGEPPPKADPIPYQAIADLYNATMADLAKVRTLTSKRRTLIRSAWQASTAHRTRKFWTAYFAECQDDAFLNGTGPYGRGHENWRPDFDYLLRADVVTKVYERAMDRLDREARRGQD